MGRKATDTLSCGLCDTPALKVIGTVSISGSGVSGRLHLAAHTSPATGKSCPGDASAVLVRRIMTKVRGRGW